MRVQPVPAANALFAGPYTFPRSRAAYHVERDAADLEAFTETYGGGEGVKKLLHAREMAEESWGYEWIHTVLVMKGRSFPTLPGLVLFVWTIMVTLFCMLVVRFDILLREDFGVDIGEAETWQRDWFIYMRGLEVRPLPTYAARPVLLAALAAPPGALLAMVMH